MFIVRMCVCVYVCMSAFVCVYVCMYVFVCVCFVAPLDRVVLLIRDPVGGVGCLLFNVGFLFFLFSSSSLSWSPIAWMLVLSLPLLPSSTSVE